jgi:hypothetical protein
VPEHAPHELDEVLAQPDLSTGEVDPAEPGFLRKKVSTSSAVICPLLGRFQMLHIWQNVLQLYVRMKVSFIG